MGPRCCGDKGGPQTSQGGAKEEQIREGSPGRSSGMDLGEHTRPRLRVGKAHQ